MANLKSAKKRARLADARRSRNAASKSSLRTAVKNFHAAVENEDKDIAKERLQLALSKIDQAQSKGILHKNNASRKKSKITKAFNQMV